ncbi:AtzH-like domain-containing protein [Naasia sp. SYSU D00948]|uniref:AtzH-like domain-containing protein n=1 Tax=Naasia sp. SYSU D00948 TaxID=2817379 RepID=UPI001FEF0813|nr:AtzH-like domain-containing protein [Naasia sp. SYSU D00948]
MAEMPRTDDITADGPVPDGLLDAFWRYEQALMEDDVAVLDELFAPGPHTLRGDAGGLLVGSDAIAAFRRARGGAPRRRIGAVHVRRAGEQSALVVAVLEPETGGRGQQTQLWHRHAEGWRIAAAHVSTPAPALDRRIWRVAGTPLVPGLGTGPLVGETVAVKDLFAIAGQRIGGGVPQYLDEAQEERTTAPAVQALLDAGADVTGIARTDQFAYSIAGDNGSYGTPPNAVVPGALPGGSSSGPASAVGLGHVSVGLATDTAGSIRVPASYQGLWGLRTTHGAVPAEGLLPLAPSFDTVGWLTRDAGTLERVAGAMLPQGGPAEQPPAVVPALLDTLESDIRAAFESAVGRLVADGLLEAPDDASVPDVGGTYSAFRTVQAAEAWRVHGEWLEAHPGAVTGAVAARFRAAAAVTGDEERRARDVLAERRDQLRRLLTERVLLLPAAASPAPLISAAQDEVDRLRAATLTLTCLAGVAGAPSLSAPLAGVRGAPLGVALVSAPGTDVALVRRAARLHP